MPTTARKIAPEQLQQSELYESQLPRIRSQKTPYSFVTSMTCLITLCSSVFWLLGNQGSQIYAASKNITTLESQITEAEGENASLQTQVEKLSSPTRVLHLAMGTLHMVHVDPVHISLKH